MKVPVRNKIVFGFIIGAMAWSMFNSFWYNPNKIKTNLERIELLERRLNALEKRHDLSVPEMQW